MKVLLATHRVKVLIILYQTKISDPHWQKRASPEYAYINSLSVSTAESFFLVLSYYKNNILSLPLIFEIIGKQIGLVSSRFFLYNFLIHQNFLSIVIDYRGVNESWTKVMVNIFKWSCGKYAASTLYRYARHVSQMFI